MWLKNLQIIALKFRWDKGMSLEHLVANDPHFYEEIGLYNRMHPVVNSHLSTVMQGKKKITAIRT